MFTRPPRKARGHKALINSGRAQAMLSLKSFHFSLESATVFCLRSPQFAIFGRRLLPFLVVAVWIFWKCFLLKLPLSSKPVSCYHCQMLLPWVSQNKMLYFPGSGLWCFFLRLELRVIWLWFENVKPDYFFFLSSTFLSGQWTHCRNIKENVCCWIKVIFFLDHIIASCGVYD